MLLTPVFIKVIFFQLRVLHFSKFLCSSLINQLLKMNGPSLLHFALKIHFKEQKYQQPSSSSQWSQVKLNTFIKIHSIPPLWAPVLLLAHGYRRWVKVHNGEIHPGTNRKLAVRHSVKYYGQMRNTVEFKWQFEIFPK